MLRHLQAIRCRQAEQSVICRGWRATIHDKNRVKRRTTNREPQRRTANSERKTLNEPSDTARSTSTRGDGRHQAHSVDFTTVAGLFGTTYIASILKILLTSRRMAVVTRTDETGLFQTQNGENSRACRHLICRVRYVLHLGGVLLSRMRDSRVPGQATINYYVRSFTAPCETELHGKDSILDPAC